MNFQRRKCQIWRSIRQRAIHHRQPENPPAEDAENRDQIGQPRRSSQPRLFRFAAGFQDLVKGLYFPA